MIRLGMVDFDTSHVIEFTRRLNHVDCAEDQRVNGAKVVLACPGDSLIMPERIGPYTETMKKYGVPLADRPEDLLGKVDGVLIESQEGGRHWPRAKPFLDAGVPCFIDKPFACSVADARRLIETARAKKAAVFSSSSLRFEPGLVSYLSGPERATRGPILGAFAHGPGAEHPRNPGLFHYGIHAVEVLFALMGPGCERVSSGYEKDAEVVTGRWKDGRLGTVRAGRAGAGGYGAVAFAEKQTTSLGLPTTHIYRELLKAIVRFFDTREAPVDPLVTLEIVAFIEAALTSRANHGGSIPLAAG